MSVAEDTSAQAAQRRGLLFLRVSWLTVLLWLGVIFVMALGAGSPRFSEAASPRQFRGWGWTVAAYAALLLIPAALFLRNQFYKAHWRGDRITLVGYARGSLAMFISVQPAALLSLLAVLVSRQMFPQIVPLGLALFVHLKTWPHGGPLRAAAPRLGGESSAPG